MSSAVASKSRDWPDECPPRQSNSGRAIPSTWSVVDKTADAPSATPTPFESLICRLAAQASNARAVHEIDGDVVVLRPASRWDASFTPTFRQQTAELLSRGFRLFAVDFSRVHYVDNSAVSSLVGLLKKVMTSTRNGDVKLFGMNDALRMVFSATGLDRAFDITDSYPQTVASFRR